MYLIRAVTGEGEFSIAYHLLALMEERRDGKIWNDVNGAKLKELKLDNDLAEPDGHLIIRDKNSSYWMTAQVTTVTGTLLVAT